MTYDRDNTDANTDSTKTYFLWNSSGSAEWEKQEHDEGVTYTRNQDSGSVWYYLDAKQLWRADDSSTSYWLTEFFQTEKTWSSTLTEATGFGLRSPDVTARTWAVENRADTQSDDDKTTWLLNSWDDGTTSLTLSAPDGKWFDEFEIPYTAKWALTTWRDTATGSTTNTYQIDKF